LLPDPETPVKAMIFPFGIVKSIFFKLFSFKPRRMISSLVIDICVPFLILRTSIVLDGRRFITNFYYSLGEERRKKHHTIGLLAVTVVTKAIQQLSSVWKL